jgi:serine/threonine protein kinase
VALQKMHLSNVIYRDLKPENVLIDNQGNIKLIDFGFSKHLHNLNKDKAYTNCGTLGYCAPEVMMGVGHSYKADIWSFGILICEMIGGHHPFSDEQGITPSLVMDKCRSGNLKLPRSMSSTARDLVK